MELFRFNKDIPFMSYGKITTAISLIIFLFSIFCLAYYKLNLSVEFTGGTLMEVEFSKPAEINQVRAKVDELGLGSSQVQSAGSSKNILIRMQNEDNIKPEILSNQVHEKLLQLDPGVVIKQTEFVGPQVGKELVTNGILALVMVSIGIIIYLAIRFEWRFALAAVIANTHDVVVILGCFAFFQWEFSLTVLAGVLAVLGYSVNEAVVIFDRIRENFRKPEMRDRTVPQVIDNAITSTMSRTIITHGSTEVMVLSMFFFGGDVLHGFSIALTIGILFGIYSSIFVGSPLLLMFGLTRETLAKKNVKKEEAVV
ncbi:protein translocase subunit SecF [Neisseriaceae bacterium PsAf]|nr:protein translocase subunit SecF [Neisseriaceae bacterium PsAf]MCV2503940.1 protein translocase subunit SecF [Neisseriaceae bacterium]